MKKKILIAIESLNCGGAEKSLVSMLPLLDYEKYEVDLLIHNLGGGLFENLVDDRVNILPTLEFVDFYKKNIVKQVLSWKMKYIVPRLKWALAIRNKSNKKRHPSEVYWENCSSAFEVLPKEYDVAIAWGQGNSTHFVSEKVNAKKKYAWINANYELGRHDKKFDDCHYQVMDGIVVVSEELLPITKEVFPQYASKMSVIYDVVNYELIKEMSLVEDVLINETRPIILTMGRLAPQKGYSLAVQACKILKDKGYSIAWYVLGEGAERTTLEKLIHENGLEDTFYLLGVKENPYVYLRKADVYVQTSIFEGYCITLAEARMFNKPIVSTNFDVVRDQIKDGENGFIVDMQPDAIAEGVIRLLESEELRSKFSHALMQEKKGNQEEAVKFMALLDV